MNYNDLNISLPTIIVLLLDKEFHLPWGTEFDVERLGAHFKYDKVYGLQILFDTGERWYMEYNVEVISTLPKFSIHLDGIRIMLSENKTNTADICILDMYGYVAQKALLNLCKRLLDLGGVNYSESDEEKKLSMISII